MVVNKVSVFDNVYVLTPDTFKDKRGTFSEVYKATSVEHIGISESVVQVNISESHKNVIRGMHYQWDRPLGKLVSVIGGAIYDVIVDVRFNSPTFGKTYGTVITCYDYKQIWIPPGYAHGFLSLQSETRVLYKYDNLYNKNGEGVINALEDYIWDKHWSKFIQDKNSVVISDKDSDAQLLHHYVKNARF